MIGHEIEDPDVLLALVLYMDLEIYTLKHHFFLNIVVGRPWPSG
jgi:hypothetical protein